MDFVANSTNVNTGLADATIVVYSKLTNVANDGLFPIQSRNFYHYGIGSALALQDVNTNSGTPVGASYIKALNDGLLDNTNTVSLQFKANPTNPAISDASIVVNSGGLAVGALNSGSMQINCGTQLLLGPVCSDIEIGGNVSALQTNNIIIGNGNSTVYINGEVFFRNTGASLQNVSGHLKQFN
jgi:hypothetical protein